MDATDWSKDLYYERAIGPYRVEVSVGNVIELPSPALLGLDGLVWAITDWCGYIASLGHDLPIRVAHAIERSYRERYGLPTVAQATRLRELVARYRPQVRADLFSEYGVDLAEWYAAGRWVGLLDLIDGLPTACRLNEAIVNDPEAAAAIANTPKSSEDWAPRVSEFDLQAHMSREILHALKGIMQILIATAGGKPGDLKPFPAPVTEVEKAIEAIERQWAESFVEQFGFDATDI